MSNILIPYKNYSYINNIDCPKNKEEFIQKKDSIQFALFKILVIAIVSVFWISEKYFNGVYYLYKSPLPHKTKWNNYLKDIPNDKIRDILLKIDYNKDIIGHSGFLNKLKDYIINSSTFQSMKFVNGDIIIDQSLFDNLKQFLPPIFLKKLKNTESYLKAYENYSYISKKREYFFQKIKLFQKMKKTLVNLNYLEFY
jgi:hypothetical protein